MGKKGAPQRLGSERAQLLSIRHLGEMWIWIRTVIQARGIGDLRVLGTCFPPAVVWQPDIGIFLALWSDEVGIFWSKIWSYVLSRLGGRGILT